MSSRRSRYRSRSRSRDRSDERYSLPIHATSSDPNPHNARLHIGNLVHYKVTRSELYNIFGKYGRVVELFVKRSYGFIQYETEKEARAAMASENNTMIKGRKVRVQMAKPLKRADPRCGDDRRLSPPRDTGYLNDPPRGPYKDDDRFNEPPPCDLPMDPYDDSHYNEPPPCDLPRDPYDDSHYKETPRHPYDYDGYYYPPRDPYDDGGYDNPPRPMGAGSQCSHQ